MRRPPGPLGEGRGAPFDGSPLDPLLGGGDAWLEFVRDAEEPTPGGRLGRYEVLGESRGGAQGVVFRARQPGTDREVALKRLSDGAYSSATARRRFEREIETLTGLSHPGIVTVYGVEQIDDLPVLAMEWIEGEPLTTWASRVGRGRAAVRQKLAMFLQVCEAVQYAHGNGVLHRDLKPSNILIDRAGRARILDFGIAQRIPGSAATVDVTRTLGFVGTPAYAAPEQLTEGTAPLDLRSDVYSLGVVLYELLTGARPFAAERLRDLIEAIETCAAPRPSARVREVGRDLDLVVAKAMVKEREHRYQTVHALAEDVRRYLAGQPVLAAPQRVGYLLGKWARRHRAVTALAATCVLLMAGSGVAMVWQAKELATERDEARAQRTRTLAEASKARAVQDFYQNTLLQAATPYGNGERDILVLLEQAAARVGKHFPEHPEAGIEILCGLTHVFQFQRKNEIAQRLVRLAEQQFAALPAPSPEIRVAMLRAQIEAMGTSDDAVAVTKLEELVAFYRAMDPPKDLALLATFIARLGTFEHRLGRNRAAEEHLREALHLSAAHGSRHATFSKMANLGPVVARNGQPDEAKAMLAGALQEAGLEFGTQDLIVARLNKALAAVLREEGDDARAARLYRRSLSIRRQLYPADHPDLAAEANTLAKCYERLGQHEQALHAFELATKSNDVVSSAVAWRGTGRCLVALGQPASAAPAFGQARQLFEQCSDESSRGHAEVLIQWLDALARAGDREAAPTVFAQLEQQVQTTAAHGGPPPGEVFRAMLSEHASKVGLAERAAALLASLPPPH
ncbi:MAG: serine/threonine-protein kinase [Planctomycetota bacterium]